MVESQQKFEYKGIHYWVSVIAGILGGTTNTYFMAYVSEGKDKPEGHLGNPVLGVDGKRQLSTTPQSAMMNAQAVMQSEIDSKG